MVGKRLGILAGRGDVRGLTSGIKSAVDRGSKIDWKEDRPGASRRSS